MMLPKKTMVCLIPGFAINENDSTCLPQQQAFLRTLKKNYPTLHIIVITFQYPYSSSPYQWHGIDIIPMNGRHKGGLLRRWLWWKIRRKLNQIKEQYTITGIISFWCSECALIGSRFGKKYGLRHSCWILGQDARDSNTYVKRIKPKPDELIALSDLLQDTFSDNHHIRPAHVVPPGIDRSEFAVMPSEKSIDIIGAGSLIPLKQFPVFLEIVAEIKRSLPGIKVMICGKGPGENSLREQIKSLYLQGNVELKGEVSHAEVLSYMQKSKVLLHPSSYEGFSGVCHEALYAGAQVVSFHKPMKEAIMNWHTVQSREEMSQLTLDLLRSPQPVPQPVLYHSIEETVEKIIHLFGD